MSRREVTIDTLRAELGCVQYHTAQLTRRERLDKATGTVTSAELAGIARDIERILELAREAVADAESREQIGRRVA